MMGEFPGHDSASETLHHIERGGHHLLMVTRRRIGAFLDELDKGEFRSAMEELDGARASLLPLAQAEATMAIASTSSLVPVRDLRPGMVLTDVGEITSVEAQDQCGNQRCSGHVQIIVGEQPVQLDADAEVYIENS